ncbi:DUF6898 family protein [Paremcibacter congregatus]|uniref:DUF6898 domain-containing protein n=1 Tax=Paremcibacter congregatus TaxID=2043170 RepID=A0A2G4YQI4_9PROT|nr:hypothetical protein [Paremcibacter congregatus]PHZ83716.1 hypothetical protein CRD36_15185 [Paremcibacter congregatus]QDE27417.1 hypothetical protein FIV45_09010 [Paremcibacter congregatus]|tara:strand:+ start:309 stop:497 length:189 start_codon:yes stop_codon:yes gene_type:complete
MSGTSEGYIIEFIQVGASTKVTAVDPATGREATIVGPSNAARSHLTQVAVRKLKYLLAKDQS